MSLVANADITLYHKSGYDKESKRDLWTATAFPGCHWHARRAAAVGAQGLTAAAAYTVRVFTSGELEAAPGDVVVRGFTSAETPQLAAAAEHFVLTAVTDNRRGTELMRHWKLEGA